MTLSRRTSVVLLIAFISLAVGAVGIQAAPACQRLVRDFRYRRVPNPVKKVVAERWALWNKSHPNFHQHARPKYKLVPQEVVKKMDFACQVPLQQTEVAENIPLIPEFTMAPEPEVVFPPPVLPDVVEITTNMTPPPPFLPPYSPGLPPTPMPVPEPSSMLLMITGAILLAVQTLFARRKAKLAA